MKNSANDQVTSSDVASEGEISLDSDFGPVKVYVAINLSTLVFGLIRHPLFLRKDEFPKIYRKLQSDCGRNMIAVVT